MLERWIGRRTDVGLLLQRAMTGTVFFAHGAQKLLGWYGGGGIEATAAMFSENQIPYPEIAAWAVALIECIGGAMLIIGLLTREAALFCAMVMVGAIWVVHYPNGFFLQGGGYEYCTMLLSGCLCLVFAGGGGISTDRILFPNTRWTFVKDPSSIKLEPPEDSGY